MNHRTGHGSSFCRDLGLRQVTDAPLDDLAERNWTGHRVAKAATNAVMNRWQDGPDTPDGVRARLRDGLTGADPEYEQRVSRVLDHVDDAHIALAISGTRYLNAVWAELPAGQSLRLTWPLTPGALGGGDGRARAATARR